MKTDQFGSEKDFPVLTIIAEKINEIEDVRKRKYIVKTISRFNEIFKSSIPDDYPYNEFLMKILREHWISHIDKFLADKYDKKLISCLKCFIDGKFKKARRDFGYATGIKKYLVRINGELVKKIISGKYTKKDRVEILSSFIFKEGNHWIVYCPFLRLSGYGITKKQAIKSFEIVLEERRKEMRDKKNFFDDLMNHNQNYDESNLIDDEDFLLSIIKSQKSQNQIRRIILPSLSEYLDSFKKKQH